MLMLEPELAKFSTESAEPRRANERTDIPEAIETYAMTLRFPPMKFPFFVDAGPSRLIPDPTRTNERIESVEPSAKYPMVEVAVPMRLKHRTERPEPIIAELKHEVLPFSLQNERTLKLEPIVKQSMIDTLLPERAKLRRLRLLPILMASNVESEEPARANVRTDIEEPIVR
jgi:hypothetical protein